MLATSRSRLPSLVSRLSPTTTTSPTITTPLLRPLSTSSTLSRQGPGSGENFIQPNDPTPRKLTPNVSKTNELPLDSMGAQDKWLAEPEPDAEKRRSLQAPNRAGIWSRSQMPRDVAMSGPRFEQTIMETQPMPYAAIELIHKQPVRWVHTKTVACDGGGGPLGHPRIFINTDKPQVQQCTYCGLPYVRSMSFSRAFLRLSFSYILWVMANEPPNPQANEHNRKYLESLPSTPYPLRPTGDPAEVEMPSSPSQMGEIQGKHPHLMGEIKAQTVGGEPAFSQR